MFSSNKTYRWCIQLTCQQYTLLNEYYRHRLVTWLKHQSWLRGFGRGQYVRQSVCIQTASDLSFLPCQEWSSVFFFLLYFGRTIRKFICMTSCLYWNAQTKWVIKHRKKIRVVFPLLTSRQKIIGRLTRLLLYICR